MIVVEVNKVVVRFGNVVFRYFANALDTMLNYNQINEGFVRNLIIDL